MTDGEAPARLLAIDGPARAGGPGPIPIAATFADLAAELRRFVLGVVRDPDLADDVMQATFLKALEHGHEARVETSRGWLFRVAFHEALASRRRSIARDEGTRRLARLRPRPGIDAPDDPLIRSEAVALVREALGKLPEEQRRVVLARVYEDKTFAEIAGESGLPIGTVLTRMRRALEKMRKTLRPPGG
jgi:RNA polymerase sigma factor (sigma-70 family)